VDKTDLSIFLSIELSNFFLMFLLQKYPISRFLPVYLAVWLVTYEDVQPCIEEIRLGKWRKYVTTQNRSERSNPNTLVHVVLILL
jgi:hypothetical protein